VQADLIQTIGYFPIQKRKLSCLLFSSLLYGFILSVREIHRLFPSTPYHACIIAYVGIFLCADAFWETVFDLSRDRQKFQIQSHDIGKGVEHRVLNRKARRESGAMALSISPERLSTVS
jgi:hypothetical protein